MKLLVVILWLFVCSLFAQTYEKSIVFEKYESLSIAEQEYKKFKKTDEYSELNSLAMGNDINIHICVAGEYIALIADPIRNKYILDEIMSIGGNKFEKMYVEDSVVQCKEVLKLNNTKIVNVCNSLSSEVYDGYTKKIILLKSSQKSRVDLALKKLKKDAIYKKLVVLADENNFKIHARPLGKNNILTIEPIHNEAVYQKVMKMVIGKYKKVRGIKDKIPNIIKTPNPTLKKSIPIVQKNMNKEVEEKTPEATNDVPVVKNLQENTTKEVNHTSFLDKVEEKDKTTALENNLKVIKLKETARVDDSDSWFSLWYVFIVLLFGGLYFLYKKYKPIYDEY